MLDAFGVRVMPIFHLKNPRILVGKPVLLCLLVPTAHLNTGLKIILIYRVKREPVVLKNRYHSQCSSLLFLHAARGLFGGITLR